MKIVIALVVTGLLAGCHQAGLSPHETQMQNYATYILSLYDTPEARGPARSGMGLPARVAVAQVGEVAPPSAMVQAMRSDPALARVEPVPGVFAEYSQQNPQEQVRLQVQRMKRFARDMGMDYLFIFGGSIDYDTHSNPLSVLDWTIVGAYLAPGKNVKASGRATGAMIDLATGHVAFVTTTEAEKERLASTATSDGQEQRMLIDLRDEMIEALGKKVVEECRHHAAPAAATAVAPVRAASPAAPPSSGSGVTIPAGAEWRVGN